ncbi:clotting factor B [Nephila pilipes]|uniref:Clotting factor B n=1 Tax=Nephila pilipes TaxID=299642 RepID=A0A8X6NZA1_NEPPI|nr:clotting factor B [Nephila pilipes]
MFLCNPKLLLLFVVGLFGAGTVQGQRRFVCPSADEYCTELSSCSSIANRFGTRNQPRICGWSRGVPRVCCPQNIVRQISPAMSPNQRRSNKISSISPNECGVRRQDTKAYKDFYNQKVRGPDGTWLNISSILAVGGTNAIEKWPWMAAIFDEDKEKQLCGGTVIDRTHIVTASHCFDDKSLNPDLYTVEVGEINLDGYNTAYKVQEIKIHENYRPGYYYNDIAIIKLTEPLSYNSIPVCLPEEEIVLQGDNVTVLGWGDLAYRGPSTTILQEVTGIPVVGNRECNAKLRRIPSAPFPRGITEDFICAGLEEGGKDACQGDSGGPLLREYSEKKFALVGIVSFGVKCAEPGFPGVYTKVSAHIPWIARYIGAQSEVAPGAQQGNNPNSGFNRRPNTGRIIFRNE